MEREIHKPDRTLERRHNLSDLPNVPIETLSPGNASETPQSVKRDSGYMTDSPANIFHQRHFTFDDNETFSEETEDLSALGAVGGHPEMEEMSDMDVYFGPNQDNEDIVQDDQINEIDDEDDIFTESVVSPPISRPIAIPSASHNVSHSTLRPYSPLFTPPPGSSPAFPFHHSFLAGKIRCKANFYYNFPQRTRSPSRTTATQTPNPVGQIVSDAVRYLQMGSRLPIARGK